MTQSKITIGTRGSALALHQANLVATDLKRLGHQIEIRTVRTTGDKAIDVPISAIEGKGLFIKELEEALLDGRIDVAVHSLKDMTTEQPPGLTIGAIGSRADRRELLLVRPEAFFESSLIPVKPGGIIGTGSARRAAQIAYHNSSAQIRELRGNVPTRVAKLREGLFDAIVVAAAGVSRLELDLSGLEAVHLDPASFLPAPGQGTLAVEIRADDARATEAVRPLDSAKARMEAALERGLLARFDSGCSLPLGVLSRVEGASLYLKAVLGIKRGGNWEDLRQSDVSGTSVPDVIEQSYRALTRADATMEHDQETTDNAEDR